jgi:shikimate dehydrogenase
MDIKGTTKLLGVIGYPISHSFSPRMHNAAINHLNADFAYLPFPIKPDNLAKAIAGFEAIDLVGFSVTIPHKQTIIPLLQEITPFAELVGAVNTVYRTEKGWCGTNTDVTGFIAPLQQLHRNWSEVTPIILGNGGAARAVVVGCAELGCPEIHVFGRNQDSLTHFYQNFQNTSLKARLNFHTWDNLEGMLSKGQLIVNTTPVGMHPHIDQSPLAENLVKKVAEGAISYDLIYNPRPSKFLQELEQQGAICCDGLEMLVQQGAAALKIWLNQEVPVEIMRSALIN